MYLYRVATDQVEKNLLTYPVFFFQTCKLNSQFKLILTTYSQTPETI